MYAYIYIHIYIYIYIHTSSPLNASKHVWCNYGGAIDSPCECEYNNPDSLDARLFFTVVLAVVPAVTMDEASSLSCAGRPRVGASRLGGTDALYLYLYMYVCMYVYICTYIHTSSPPMDVKRSTPTQQPTIPWSSLLRQRPRQCSTLQLTQQGGLLCRSASLHILCGAQAGHEEERRFAAEQMLAAWCTHLYMSISVSIYIYLSTYLSIHPSIHLSIHLSISIYVCIDIDTYIDR